MEQKKCKECHELKPLADFYKRSDSRDGYYTKCKRCHLDQTRESYKRTDSPEKRRRNIERVLAWRAKNRQHHQFYVKSYLANRRASSFGIEETISRQDVEAIYEAQNGRCRRCTKPFCDEDESSRPNLDHVVSFREGGANTPDNLQFLCEKCHDKKNGEEVGERNKRQGHW